MRETKGNLLITFILLIALAAAVIAFISFVTVQITETGSKITTENAFYYADAGLNKAVWLLANLPASGGVGSTYRVQGSMESIGKGDYRYSIINTTDSYEVLVVSTGEISGIKKTIQQMVNIGGYPTAFKYALYTGISATMNGAVNVVGDTYINGNTTMTGAAVLTGKLYHPAGTTINPGSQATYTDGGPVSPPPADPILDTTYYDSYIATAKTKTAGGVDYNSPGTVNLNGGIIYVNGDIHVNDVTTFNGPGKVVASGAIVFNKTTTCNGALEFISSTSMYLNDMVTATKTNFYSNGDITINANTRLDIGSFISDGNVTFTNSATVTGLVYANKSILLQGNPLITGVVVATNASGGANNFNGPVKIVYDQKELPTDTPHGITGLTVQKVPGTWISF